MSRPTAAIDDEITGSYPTPPVGANTPEATTAAEPSAEDERLIAVLDEYAAVLERGENLSPEEFAAKHSELDDQLLGYLKGVHALHAAVESARDRHARFPGQSRLGAASSGSPTVDLHGSRHAAGAPLPDAPDDPGPPQVLGDYRVEREIGRGGMGVVYEATEQSLRRRVALKVLPFAAVLDQRQIARFRNEAQAAAGLHHAHIVPVFAIGQERGVHYYAMQYIEGQSLAQAIAELRRAAGAGVLPDATTADVLRSSASNPTPQAGAAAAPSKLTRDHGSAAFIRSAARLAADAADALQHAHDLGVVHRDVKPSNLLLDLRGKVWVADFGLARMQSDLGVTATGDVVGTLRYMSPEQARGQADRIDGRTDVYGLGATLYELLTLRQAFPAEDRVRLLESLEKTDPIPPRRLNPAIPPDLENIVQRAMEKDRDTRYASAAELRDDLLRFLDGRPTIARPPSVVDRVGKWMHRRRRIVSIAAAAMGVVAVVSLASAFWVNMALVESEVHRTRAERLLDQARGVLNRFGAELSDELAATPGAEAIRSQLLRDTQAYYRYFLAESAGDPRLAVSAAETRVRAAAVAERLGDQDEALTLYTEAVDGLEAIVTSAPQNEAAVAWLARGLNNRGLLLAQQEESQRGAEDLARSVDLRRSLLAEKPDDPDRMADLAATLSDTAAAGRDTNRKNQVEASQRQLEEAILLLGRARRVDDEAPGPARRLAVAHNSLASLLRSSDPQRAAVESDRAVEQLTTLTTREPAVEDYRADLAMAYSNRGALAADGGDWPRAAEAYHAASTELTTLALRSPLVPRHRSELAVALASEAAALARAGRRDESDAAFDQAQQALERLVASYPSADRYQRSLAALWNNRGVVLRDSGRLEEAAPALARAVELEEKRLRKANPSGPTLLATHYANYAQLLGRLGRIEEAAAVETKRLALIKPTSGESAPAKEPPL